MKSLIGILAPGGVPVNDELAAPKLLNLLQSMLGKKGLSCSSLKDCLKHAASLPKEDLNSSESTGSSSGVSAAIENEQKVLNEKMDKLEEQNQDLEKELKQRTNLEKGKLEEAREEAKQELLAKQAKDKEIKEEKERKLAELTASIQKKMQAEFEIKANEIRSVLNATNTEKTTCEESLGEVQKEKESLTSELDSVKKQVEELQKQKAEMLKKANDGSDKFQQLKSEADGLTSQLKDAENERKAQADLIAEIKLKNLKIIAEAKKKQAEIVHLKEEIVVHQKTMTEKMQKLKAGSANEKVLRDENTALSKRLEALTEQNTQMSTELETVKAKLDAEKEKTAQSAILSAQREKALNKENQVVGKEKQASKV